MANPRRLLPGLVLFLFPVFTRAVSLSDFTPRNTGLSPQCNAVYTQTIPGCQQSDFTGSNPNVCSLACVKGLASVQTEIQSKCNLDEVSETSMVGLFLLGSGISILCPNFKVQTISSTTASAKSTPPAATGFSTSQASPETTAASSPPTDSSPAASATTSDPAVATSSGGLIFDTTAAPKATGGFSVLDTSSTTSSAAARQSQKSNKDSGGGSPFDVQATSGSVPTKALLLPKIVSLVFALVFQLW